MFVLGVSWLRVLEIQEHKNNFISFGIKINIK